MPFWILDASCKLPYTFIGNPVFPSTTSACNNHSYLRNDTTSSEKSDSDRSGVVSRSLPRPNLWNSWMSDAQHTALFTAVYGEHHTWLQRWLYRRLGCPEVAADLAQDTFVRVLHKRALSEVEQPRAYLATIAHSLFVNLLRRRQLEQSYLEALAQLPEALMPSPEDRLQLLQTLHALDTLLNGLPYKVRKAFLLCQLEGLTHRQIAEQLGVSQSSVRQYIARALLQCMTAVAQDRL